MTLTQKRRLELEDMLANEADMAFKSRAVVLYEFLELAPGDRLLDMGSGRGFFLNFTRTLYPEVEVTGIELDQALLRVARIRVPGAEVASADVLALPFPDASFDKIMFTEVLEHVADDLGALAELYRVLKPGGTLALTTPHSDYPLAWDPINKVLEATVGRPIRRGPLAGIWANHVRLYTPEGLAQLVAAAGFEIRELRPLVRHAFPFIHNLVYGLGKPLLERGLLPEALATAADRFATRPPAAPWNPVRLGLYAFNAVDALNRRAPPRLDRPFLLIALQLVKPAHAA